MAFNREGQSKIPQKPIEQTETPTEIPKEKENLEKEIDAEAEKAATVARLKEAIEKAKRIIEDNEKREEAILQRLAELEKETTPDIENTEETDEKEEVAEEMEKGEIEGEKEIEKRLEKLQEEVETLQAEREKLEAEWRDISPVFSFLKDRKKRKEIDELDRKIEEGRKEIGELKDKRNQQAEETEEKKRKEDLEEDKKQNPFKYFIIDEMSDEAFMLIFREKKEAISLDELNKKLDEPEKISDWEFRFIRPETHYTTLFTSNGFSLQLQNAEIVAGEEDNAKVTQNPDTKYRLVGPNWKFFTEDDGLSYNEGRRLIGERAQKYQEELSYNFTMQRKTN